MILVGLPGKTVWQKYVKLAIKSNCKETIQNVNSEGLSTSVKHDIQSRCRWADPNHVSNVTAVEHTIT